jgi:hypothetical protein
MTSLRFTIKPAPVLAEHRPLYKIAQLLLVLVISSRGGKSSLARLQLFNWALKKRERSDALKEGADTGKLAMTGWGFDPAVPIALRYAIADGLVEDVSTGYVVTSGGEEFARAAIAAGLFESEQEVLKNVAKSVTETMVAEVARRWES